MKKYLYLLLIMVCLSTTAYSQAIHVFHDNQPKGDVYLNAEVDSIRIKSVAGESGKYEYLLYTTTGEVKYDMAKVDSIKFNLPHLKLVSHKGKCQIPNENDIYFEDLIYFNGDDASMVMRMPNGKIFGGNRLSSSDSYSYHIHRLFIPTQELYETREGESEEVWYAVDGDGEKCDSLTVEFTGKPLFQNQWHDIAVSSEATEFKLRPLIDNIQLGTVDNCPWLDGWEEWPEWADWEYDPEGNIIIKFQENEFSETRELNINPHTEYLSCAYPMGRFVQVRKFEHTAEEHMAALKYFYNSTNIKDLNTNWFSDEPLWKWDFHINHGAGIDFYWHINDHVVNLQLWRDISGTLPSSFEVFMDEIHGIGQLDLSNSSLYGTIPQNIKNNKHWQEYGWNILPQFVWSGGGFDLEGSSNLFLDESEVEDFISGDTTTVYDVLAKNRLTWVFNGGAVDMIDGISDERVNKYLDYRDKGFGLVVTVGGAGLITYDRYRDYVVHEKEENGLPEDILWTKRFDKADIGSYGSMSLVNDKGELVWYHGSFI